MTLISYPQNADLRYYASTFADKQKLQKLQDKKLLRTTLNEDFFRIKRKPDYLNIDVSTEEYKDTSCRDCFRVNTDFYVENYYVNGLNISQLFSLENSTKQSFKYLRLIFLENEYSVDVSHIILKNEELLCFVNEYEKYESSRTDHDIISRVTYQDMISSIDQAIKKFSYNLSSLTLKLIGTVMYSLSSIFMERLILSSVEFKNLEKVQKQNLPVIYMLKNQSQIDWFITLLILVFTKMKIPVVLMHKNVNSKLLSWILRKCGVIFVRPECLDIHSTDAKSKVCDEAWFIYIEEMIRAHNHFILYLDTPDRVPDAYLLKAITDSIRRNTVQDVILVPVIVSREKDIEKFSSEKLLGSSLWSKLTNLFYRRKYNLGFVNVDFFTPFSLRDFIYASGEKTKEVCEISQDEMISLLPKICKHLKYDFYRMQPILSTNLISYLLLKKFRIGVSLSELCEETNELRYLLKCQGKRLGFTGSSESVIKHVVKVLGPKLIIVENKDNEQIVKPVLNLPGILELQHYAHDTFTHFFMDAVIFTSISTIYSQEFESAFKDDNELKFTFNQLCDVVKRLCSILQFEYTFEKFCQPFECEFGETLQRLSTEDVISRIERLMTEEEQWGHRYARILEDSDEEDMYDDMEGDRSPSPPRRYLENEESYLLNLNSEKSVFKLTVFYKNALQPYIDAYVASAEHLSTLIDTQVLELYYFKTLVDKMKLMLVENQLHYPESLSSEMLQNTIKLFEEWNVVVRYRVDGLDLLSLSTEYNKSDALMVIVERIKKFQ